MKPDPTRRCAFCSRREGRVGQRVEVRRRRGGDVKNRNGRLGGKKTSRGSRRSCLAARGSGGGGARSGWIRTLICMVMSSMRAWLLMTSELKMRSLGSRLRVCL